MTRYNYSRFFGEKSYKDYSLTNRLECIVKIREFISQYVNEENAPKTHEVNDFEELIGFLKDFGLRLCQKLQ